MAPSPGRVECNLVGLCAAPDAARGRGAYVQSARGRPRSAEGLENTPLPCRLETREAGPTENPPFDHRPQPPW
eukprot:9469556-Pyramimonas_sp.AAC.1